MTESLFDMIDPPKKSTDWKWTFADYPKEKNGIKVFSCFACGGGSTMGYKLAGCDVIGCVEIDPKVNEIYVRNHHPKHNFCMDLREFNKIPDDQLPPELFNLDILDGSPPCTTFSTAGQREKTWGKKKKFREGQIEQTLDDLSFVFIDTVRKLKPRVVIMENVEGLILGNAFSYVQRIYKEFASAGYLARHWLLKGENMGIPQRRHRVFFVAIRADHGFDPDWLDLCFNYEPVLFKQITGGKAKEMRKDTQQYAALQKAIKGQDHLIKHVLVREFGKSSCFNDVIIWLDEVPSTMTSKGNIMCGDDVRKVTDLEKIRMQTFPEDYDFMTQSVSYICGMSVPPIMIKRIVTRLIEQGVFNYKEKEKNV